MKELEGFFVKHRYQATLLAMLVLSGIFGMGIIWSRSWSILFSIIGAIIGLLIPEKVSKMLGSVTSFILKQDKSTQLILAGVVLVLSILASPLIFLLLGVNGGKSLHTMTQSGPQHKR